MQTVNKPVLVFPRQDGKTYMFGVLVPGDIFELGGSLHMKVRIVIAGEPSEDFAVGIASGVLDCIPVDAAVVYCNEVLIQRK